MTSPTETRIVTYVGNFKRWTFEIKEFRQKGLADVSGASGFQVTWEDASGAHQPIVTLSDSTPGADWANGLVVLELTPSNFTAAQGTYSFALTMLRSGETITIETGFVEVKERPGHPPS